MNHEFIFPVVFIDELSSLNMSYPQAFIMCHHSVWRPEDSQNIHSEYLNEEELATLLEEKKQCSHKHYFIRLIDTEGKVSYTFREASVLKERPKKNGVAPYTLGFHTKGFFSDSYFDSIVFHTKTVSQYQPHNVDIAHFNVFARCDKQIYPYTVFNFNSSKKLLRLTNSLKKCCSLCILWAKFFGFETMIISSPNDIRIYETRLYTCGPYVYGSKHGETEFLLYRKCN